MSAAQKVIDMWNWKVERLANDLRRKLESYDLPGPYRLDILDRLYPEEVLAAMEEDDRFAIEEMGRFIVIKIVDFKEEPRRYFIQPGGESQTIQIWDMVYKPRPNTKSEDDIMNNEQFQTFVDQQRQQHTELLAVFGEKQTTSPGLLEKIKTKWEVLAVIGAIFLAGWGSSIYIGAKISEAVAPIKDDISNIKHAMNGEIGKPGMLTQLEIINGKLGKAQDSRK